MTGAMIFLLIGVSSFAVAGFLALLLAVMCDRDR